MAVFRYRLLLLSLLAVFLPSCLEDMGGGKESEDVYVSTVAEGSYLRPDDSIAVRVETGARDIQISRVRLRILDADGRLLWGSAEDLLPGSLPPVSLEGYAEGHYRLSVDVFDTAGQNIRTETVHFFVTRARHQLLNIYSYPPTVTPESDVLLVAGLSVPEGETPYLQWRFRDEVIASERDVGDFAVLQWRVPESPGVYSIRAELFPEAPAEGTYSFRSANYLEADIFVYDSVEPAAGELSPEGDYLHLLHFKGNFRDDGFAVDAPRPELGGSAALALRDGVFGYAFGPETSLTFPSSWIEGVLPDGDRAFRSFGFHVKGYFEDPDAPMPLFADGSQCVLSLVPGGFEFYWQGIVDTLLVPDFGAMILSVSVLRQDDGYWVLWYFDGELARSTQVFPGAMSAGDLAVVGGGFAGILDELGMYLPEAGVPFGANQYRIAMEGRYGNGIIAAEGFDAEISSPYLRFRGPASALRQSTLVLEEGSELTVSGLSLDAYDVELRFEVSGAEPEILVSEDSGEEWTPEPGRDASVRVLRLHLGERSAQAGELLTLSSSGFTLTLKGGDKPARLRNLLLLRQSPESGD